MEGRPRYSIKPIDEQLSFDKVQSIPAALLMHLSLSSPCPVMSVCRSHHMRFRWPERCSDEDIRCRGSLSSSGRSRSSLHAIKGLLW